MSVRLALEFNGRTLRAQDMEKKLVEKHIRVCLSVDARFEKATPYTEPKSCGNPMDFAHMIGLTNDQ
jgi:hypothetical protein